MQRALGELRQQGQQAFQEAGEARLHLGRERVGGTIVGNGGVQVAQQEGQALGGGRGGKAWLGGADGLGHVS